MINPNSPIAPIVSLSKYIILRDTILPCPWCSGARSLGTIGIGRMLQNVLQFKPGMFTLIFPIKAYVFCERSNKVKPKARMRCLRNLTS